MTTVVNPITLFIHICAYFTALSAIYVILVRWARNGIQNWHLLWRSDVENPNKSYYMTNQHEPSSSYLTSAVVQDWTNYFLPFINKIVQNFLELVLVKDLKNSLIFVGALYISSGLITHFYLSTLAYIGILFHIKFN